MSDSLGQDDAGLAHLDCYLDQVRRYLRPLPAAEAEEAVQELRFHVLDKVEGAPTPQRVEAAIAALGTAREVARVNLTERVAAEVAQDRSPFTVLRGVARLAFLSAFGFFAGFVSLVGYLLSAGFLITAISKLVGRTRVGFWQIPGRQGGYHYAFGAVSNPDGRELLGWWIVPVSLAACALLGWLTWRFGLFSLRLMGRAAGRRR